jgi:pimeloyl-ACP methyl ester carboxylesterase
MPRWVGYAWNNDVALAYEVVGTGSVDLLLLAGAPSNLDVQWESPAYADFLRRLADGRRLIITDRRGTGLSDRFSPGAIPPIESLTDDLLRVLEAVRSPGAVVMAWAETTLVAQLFAATHPDRCVALIMIDPAAAFLPTPEMPWLPDEGQQEAMLASHRTRWGVSLSDEIGREMQEAEREWYLRLQRGTTPPGALVAEERRWMQTDTTALLPAIHVPTLVLADEDGAGYSAPENARFVAERIPTARLVSFRSHDQHVWRAPARAILAEASAFIETLESAEAVHDRVLATVLFTDIVDSSARAAAAGDREWRGTRAQHDAIARASIARYRGREVKTLGDGFLVTFDAPGRGVRCAQEIADGVRALGIEVRAGLHIGEIEMDGSDIAGIAVAIAARVSALAGAGEVLVSGTIKDLTAGSGISFDDRGTHQLKGIPDRWRL